MARYGWRHGMARTRVYRRWSSMKARCANPNNKAYRHYGGRGIAVCPRWLADFNAFYADMGDPPPGTSLERKDNERGYEPGNCCWAAKRTQVLNRRVTKTVVYRGTVVHLADLALTHGLRPNVLRTRVFALGWTVNRAIKTPTAHRPRRALTLNGKTKCLRDWERELGLGVGAIWHRLKNGWSVEKALSTPRTI